LKLVANFFCLGSPNWPVAGLLANQGVGNLVKDYLLNFFKAAIFNQVPADGDSFSSEVTLTRSVDCPIKSERIIDDAMLDEKLFS
jgi:hypothetical protein